MVAEVQKSRGDGGRGNSCSQKKWTLYAGIYSKRCLVHLAGEEFIVLLYSWASWKFVVGSWKFVPGYMWDKIQIQSISFLSLIFLGFFFFFGHTEWHVGSNPCPLLWDRGVLATGPPGKSPHFVIISEKDAHDSWENAICGKLHFPKRATTNVSHITRSWKIHSDISPTEIKGL